MSSCAKKRQDSLLWEISGNGLKSSSYILGSIHSIPASRFNFSSSILEKFKECRTVMFEANLDSIHSISSEVDDEFHIQFANEYLNYDEKIKVRKYLIDSLSIKKYVVDSLLKLKLFDFERAIDEIKFGKMMSVDFYFYDKSFNKKVLFLDNIDETKYYMRIYTN